MPPAGSCFADSACDAMWDLSTVADHLGQLLERAEADLRLEQAVYGLDAREELAIQTLLAKYFEE